MKLLAKILALLALSVGVCNAQEVGQYPNAVTPLVGNERILADQQGMTVNITTAQLQQFFFPNSTLPVALGGTGVPSITGLIVGNGTAPFSTATAANVYSLFGCTGSATSFLNGAGGCSTPAGGGTVTTTGSPANGNIAKFSGAQSITNAASTDIVGIFTGTCTPSAARYLATDGSCQLATAGGTVTSITLSGSGPLSFTGSPCTTACVFGLTYAGTSGGLIYFSSASTVASSALLAANQLILGGGAGTAPFTLGSTGTNAQVLVGNAGGGPTWGAVNLATMTGASVLAAINGGTGVANSNSNTLTMSGPGIWDGSPSGKIAPKELPICTAASNLAAQACPLTASTTLTLVADGQLVTVNCASACTITIPPNSGGGSVPYPGGTILAFWIYPASATVTVTTSDNIQLANSASTGPRTLPATVYGICQKYDATTHWYCSGPGML